MENLNFGERVNNSNQCKTAFIAVLRSATNVLGDSLSRTAVSKWEGELGESTEVLQDLTG